MSMYKLTPTFPSDFEVAPKTACYRVASYHNPMAGTTSPGVARESQAETDPRKALEKKQQELIDRLKGQTEQLNKLLVSFAPVKKEAPICAKPAQKPQKETTPDPATGGKKDKDAKKEARKAAKAEAVKKIAGGAPIASNAKETKSSSTHGTNWTVEDDRKTWETNLTLTVNLPTSLVVYAQESLKTVTLTVRDQDISWVSALAKVGAKRGVAFEGEVSNQTKEKKTTVKVVKGASPALQIENTTVKTLQTIWKLLGSALGLYSRRPQQVLSASHQAMWLKKAEEILLGTGDLLYSTREASQFLARFDSLSSQWEVSMADIIFRSLLNLAEAHPNNVESWAKKIDALVAVSVPGVATFSINELYRDIVQLRNEGDDEERNLKRIGPLTYIRGVVQYTRVGRLMERPSNSGMVKVNRPDGWNLGVEDCCVYKETTKTNVGKLYKYYDNHSYFYIKNPVRPFTRYETIYIRSDDVKS